MDQDCYKDYKEFKNVIPFISFPSDWGIKIIPPFGGAIIRFVIKKDEKENISVYFDGRDSLGYCGRPYWEVYPVLYKDHIDAARFFANETEQLLKCIQCCLDGKFWALRC